MEKNLSQRLIDTVRTGNGEERLMVDRRGVEGDTLYIGTYTASGITISYYCSENSRSSRVEMRPNEDSAIASPFLFDYDKEGMFNAAALYLPSHIPGAVQESVLAFKHASRDEQFSLLYQIAKEEIWMAEILSQLVTKDAQRSPHIESRVWNDITKNISQTTRELIKALPWINENISAWISQRYTYTNEEGKAEQSKTNTKICRTNTLKHLDFLLERTMQAYSVECSKRYSSSISIRSIDDQTFNCVCILPDGTEDSITLGSGCGRTSHGDLTGELARANHYCSFHFSLGSIGLNLKFPTEIKDSDFVCAILENDDRALHNFMKRWSFDMVDYQAQKIAVLQRFS